LSWLPLVAAEFADDLDLSLPLEDILPSAHEEPLVVEGAVATYVSRGRAYRGPAPSPPLPPLGHGTGGSSSAPGPASQVDRERAALVAFVQSLWNPGRSRDKVSDTIFSSLYGFILFTCMREIFLPFFTV